VQFTPMFMTPKSRVACLALGALALAGCGGGGSSGGGTVTGLSVADSMAVVTTNGGGSSAVVAPHAQADTSGFSATCDYNTDVSRAHVYDPSMEPLQTVNMILCLLKQTAYSGLVNEGVYKAQIDENSCNAGGGGGDTGQSSGTAQSFNIWVIESSRASATGAQNVEFWIPPMAGDGDQHEIRVRMTITKGRDETNPFGVFTLNFIELNTDESIRGLGNLHTLDAADGYIGFAFYQEQGDVDTAPSSGEHAQRIQANVSMTADQTQGLAHILSTRRENFSGDTGPITNEYALAFDETHVLRETDNGTTTTQTCLSRVDFSTRTWRYNLYDATTGDRIEGNSGFGFQTEEGAYGWVGYYGLWLPADAELESGDTVTRNTFGGAAPETYTVLKAPGKLVKNTRNTLALTALAGVEFEWWHPSLVGGFHMVRDHVEYQSPNWVATERWDDESQGWVSLGSPVVINVASLGFLGMYSDSLGGQCSYVYGDTSITYFKREIVAPNDPLFADDDTVELDGYFNCLRSGITTSEVNSGDVYLTDSNDVQVPHRFTMHQEDMALTRTVSSVDVNVGLADGEAPTQGPNMWGMSSGPLVTTDVQATLESPQDVWNVAVFYTYETGSNPWNQYATVLDANLAPIVFEKPLQFAYTHDSDDDANGDTAFDGRTYLLTYNGAGDLGGIPFTGVDFDGDTNPDRYYPDFSIKTGTLCGPTGTEYVIRAVESEQTLATDTGNCGSLTISGASALALPDDGDWTDPAMSDRPTVDDAPRVIEGDEVESEDNG